MEKTDNERQILPDRFEPRDKRNSMPKIWVSHSNSDKDIAFIAELSARLIADGCLVASQSTSASGDYLFSIVAESIHESDILLAVVSGYSEDNRFFHSEISYALSLGYEGPRVIPILIDDNVVLPDFLSYILGINLSDYESMEDLAHDIESIALRNKKIDDDDDIIDRDYLAKRLIYSTEVSVKKLEGKYEGKLFAKESKFRIAILLMLSAQVAALSLSIPPLLFDFFKKHTSFQVADGDYYTALLPAVLSSVIGAAIGFIAGATRMRGKK